MQFADLTAEQNAALEYDREFLSAVLAARFRGQSPTGETPADLSIIQLVVDNGPYTEDPVEELEALGTSFGDLIAPILDLHWVAYTDEDGTDLALRYHERSIVIFPRDVLVKHAERDEDIDVHYLFEQLCIEVREMIDSEEFR